jgi:hypothetical protein
MTALGKLQVGGLQKISFFNISKTLVFDTDFLVLKSGCFWLFLSIKTRVKFKVSKARRIDEFWNIQKIAADSNQYKIEFPDASKTRKERRSAIQGLSLWSKSVSDNEDLLISERTSTTNARFTVKFRTVEHTELCGWV